MADCCSCFSFLTGSSAPAGGGPPAPRRQQQASSAAAPLDEAASDVSETDNLECNFEPQEGYSYIGQAVQEELGTKFAVYQDICWNLTSGKLLEVAQTPPNKYYLEDQITRDVMTQHSMYFPKRMGAIMSMGTRFVDFTSLGPPTDRFVDNIAQALKNLNDSGNEVTVRILTGNITGMPTNNHALLKELTQHPDFEISPEGSKLKIWVGSWRKGLTSWNHSKIIAVDGKHLFTGGHNVWDPHYLVMNPVRDLSMEFEGHVAIGGHRFANRMWKFIIKNEQRKRKDSFLASIIPVLSQKSTGLEKWPADAEDYPPFFEDSSPPPQVSEARRRGSAPMITMGRLGALHHSEATANPSDKGIVRMLQAAKQSIKMSLQDLGPLAIPPPVGPIAIPGAVWPKNYLRELGLAIYERGVNVDIVLSSPNSIPGNLSIKDANYGNGWSCDDVAAEIIRAIGENVRDVDQQRLEGLVGINLRVTFLRSTCGPEDWKKKGQSGNHAKMFIVDDQAFLMGSQNLYIANLAEWGVVVDDKEVTQRVLDEYWKPMWARSYDDVPEGKRDCRVDRVLKSLNYNKGPKGTLSEYSVEEQEAILLAKKASKAGGSENSLTVWVREASKVKDTDGFGAGSSDSYCVLRIVDRHGKQVGFDQKTRTINDGGENPRWNQTVDFEGLDTPEAYKLEIYVFDADSFLGLGGAFADNLVADEKLGACSVDLGTLEKSRRYQQKELIFDAKEGSKLIIALNTRDGWGK